MTPEQAAIKFIENIAVSKERASELSEALTILIHAQRAEAVAEAQKWRPIETAPKDGTPILLLKKGYTPCAGQWLNCAKPRWIEGDVFDKKCRNPDCFRDYLEMSEYNPTHWQPLPPAQEGEG